MTEGALQRIIESLSQDLEEKINQLSQVRQVAEAVTGGIHESHYFSQLCADFVEIFDAAVCGLFWQRIREPRSWWLDAWAGRQPMQPLHKMIPEKEEGIFGWIKKIQKPHLMEEISGESFLDIWGGEISEKPSAVIIPLNIGEPRLGMMVLIDPCFKLSPKSIQLQLEILSSLINSGIHNRMLYKGMQDSEEEFRDLFEHSSDMVVVAFPDGVIRDCNPLFEEKLGLTANPRGRQLTELITADKNEEFAQCWSRLVKGEAVHNIDIVLMREDGEPIEAELSGNVRMLSGGRPGLIRLYLRDVTERRRAERRHRELELELELARERQLAQMGLFVSEIAHNLQNPVQVLLGYLELLKIRKINIPELNVIEQSTHKIMNIIRNLLDKMQKERATDATEIDINELLDSELTFLEANSFFKHEVSKKYQFGPNLPKVTGVYSDFSQAVMNIIYNALDAMRSSEQKELKVRTEYHEESDVIRLSITDSGPGIPEEVGEKIFKPFFTTKEKSDNQETGLSSGSGLGLSSSLALLKSYGGSITYDSIPGKGTTFYVVLPVSTGAGG